jgi:hypothetical protein
MSSPEPLADRMRLRVGDADRHRVAELLREAAGEGRLDLDELDQRLEATFRAKTYADLVPLTLDLPGASGGVGATGASWATPGMPVGPGAAGAGLAVSGVPERHLAVLSGFERKGVWTMPARMEIVAFMGGADLDLRHASYAAPVCELRVNAVMGGVSLTVPQGVRVLFSMTCIMGGHSDDPGVLVQPDDPTLLIKGFCLMGGVSVTRAREPN